MSLKEKQVAASRHLFFWAYDVISNRSAERKHLWKHPYIRILLWI